MIRKTNPMGFLIFLFFGSFLLNFPVFAQTTTDDICTQVQCVKVQNGYLWVLSSDNVTYVPYFVKAVGYDPMPIGRQPSDWGYPSSDPRSKINNIFDDPAILNRDFHLLQKMNANTIRVWSGNNTMVPGGEFPNKITNASTTQNANTNQNTLDIADAYGLKVIAGFWVNQLTFDSNNNIGSVDGDGNPLSRQQIINNFVAYINTFKGNRAILCWAIGNEVNNQTINGQHLSSPQLTVWYALVNSMAQAVHNAEGAYFHPVAVINADVLDTSNNAEIGNPSDGTTDAQLPYLDIWGINAYRGKSFNTLFSDYHQNRSSKPLLISEFGIDAFSTVSSKSSYYADINNWQQQYDNNGEYLKDEGSLNENPQSAWDVALWDEIKINSPVTIGGSVMEYADEWWQPAPWYCTIPNPTNDPTINQENTSTNAYCISTHSNFGNVFPAFLDDFMNQQWFGIMSIGKNPTAGQPDIMTPRTVYSNLEQKWKSNPWYSVTLNITGSGQGSISSLASVLGAGLSCNFSSGSSTGICTTCIPQNQKVALSFASNNSIVSNWGVAGCAPGSATCKVTPDIDIILNVSVVSPYIIASAGTEGVISPSGVVGVAYGANPTFTFTPYTGYLILQVFVDGSLVKFSGNTYTFTDVIAPHKIKVTFTPSGG